MTAALVFTVLDEAESLTGLLETIDAQTRQPDEIVVVDGGSHDGTEQLLREWAARRGDVQVLVEPGANISRGRNVAIRAAAADVIAVTDGGCRLDPDWLAELLAPMSDPEVDVAMGFYRPDPHSAFEALCACLNLPAADDVDPARFMPSSRSVAFRRRMWEQVGGYPEWLAIGEDMQLDLRMVEAGARRVFVPTAIARWRLRPTLRGFLTQYYRYARGDGIARMWPRRHAMRFAFYGGVLVLSLSRRTRPLLVVPAVLWGWWLRGAVGRTRREFGARWPLAAAALVPLQVAQDVAKMAGYLDGRRHRRPG